MPQANKFCQTAAKKVRPSSNGKASIATVFALLALPLALATPLQIRLKSLLAKRVKVQASSGKPKLAAKARASIFVFLGLDELCVATKGP